MSYQPSANLLPFDQQKIKHIRIKAKQDGGLLDGIPGSLTVAEGYFPCQEFSGWDADTPDLLIFVIIHQIQA